MKVLQQQQVGRCVQNALGYAAGLNRGDPDKLTVSAKARGTPADLQTLTAKIHSSDIIILAARSSQEDQADVALEEGDSCIPYIQYTICMSSQCQVAK